MIPRAKNNLHECEHHLREMSNFANTEEFEIHFAAFVNSARNVTFVLQKEFRSNELFDKWYKDKQDEMSQDELCKRFVDLRNKIDKEGVNDMEYSTHIEHLTFPKDILGQPANSATIFNAKGVFHLVGKGTPKEDRIPAKTTGQLTTLCANMTGTLPLC